jgi:hypothetical protein
MICNATNLAALKTSSMGALKHPRYRKSLSCLYKQCPEAGMTVDMKAKMPQLGAGVKEDAKKPQLGGVSPRAFPALLVVSVASAAFLTFTVVVATLRLRPRSDVGDDFRALVA